MEERARRGATFRQSAIGNLQFSICNFPVLVAVLCLTLLAAGICRAESKWEGVDKTVVEKMARDAGHPPSEPLINIERGDLPLFLFLLAGAVGGFVAGYTYRGLFPPRKPDRDSNAPTP